MAIIKDREGKNALMKVVGKRLVSARKMARLRQEDAAKVIGHKNITQVSQAESGERLLPFHEMTKLARLYAVPLDWLAGIIDDPLADPMETNQGVILHATSSTIKESFEVFANAMAQNVAIAVAGHREDRADLKDLSSLAKEGRKQLARIAELNPQFEEELRGSAQLDATLRRMGHIADKAALRIGAEERMVAEIDKNLQLEEVNTRAEQFLLVFG